MAEQILPPQLTLTSLLNTLHTHLQAQTQLLPTLHAQLGLPPGALADELARLQQQLMRSAEAQVRAREEEVEAWLARCEEVEGACVRYARALGGNVKATGSSVGELRREQVLPKRYEMVSQHQEKLRQVYHTKLEQLTTLGNRLSALARTLGADFFAPDILEPLPVQGEDATDPSANRDVTPERFLKLEKELVRGKGEVSKRLSRLSALFVQIDWLYTELGISPPSLDELPVPSSSLLAIPSATRPSSSCSHISDPFSVSVSTPTPGSRSAACLAASTSSGPGAASGSGRTPDAEPEGDAPHERVFARFALRLAEADAEALPDGSAAGLEGVEPAPALLAWAGRTRAALEDLKRRREAHIQALYDQLEGLWRRLGVRDADMDAFVEAHRGSTEESVREYEEELERMLELKRERMGAFVQSAREEIARLWDELMVGEEEKQDFAPFFDDEATEELLTLHEEEIRRLKEERRAKAPLLAALRRYFEICGEERELATAASDQSRLLGRGPRDPGRLLREEKMRKRVSKEKPRLEHDLLAAIPAWEAEAGRAFLVHGEPVLRLLADAASAADQENRGKRGGAGAKPPPARAGSVPPRATTPQEARAGGKGGGAVTPAVRPASAAGLGGAQSAPSKRQKTGAPHEDARAPLGAHRGGALNGGAAHARARSPSKIPGGAAGQKGAGSALPRPTAQQHHALGHGRAPSASSLVYGALRSASASLTSSTTAGAYAGARFPSSTFASSTGSAAGGGGSAAALARKASRARRESFKPRPSADGLEAPLMGGGAVGAVGRWKGLVGAAVKEEEEDY